MGEMQIKQITMDFAQTKIKAETKTVAMVKTTDIMDTKKMSNVTTVIAKAITDPSVTK